jgi:3-phenylpropionate/cinnamic acid dioxygenase small subunit
VKAAEPDERADRQDIGELLVRYASGIDGRDWDLFRSCFTSDCRAEYEDIGSWDDLEGLTRFMVDAHAGLGHTQHRISNAAITVEGDRASARTYVDLVGMSPDGTSGINSIGWYDDELVRTAGGWRIAHRRYRTVHMRAL